MQVLGSYRGRATSVQMVADSELRVTEVEWTRSPMTSADRENAALVDVRNVEKHWPDPRLRRVTVVFERLRRLGPLVVGKSDTALLKKLNAFVIEMKDSGELEKLKNKWLTIDNALRG